MGEPKRQPPNLLYRTPLIPPLLANPRDALPDNNAVLLLIPLDPKKVIAEIAALHVLQKLLVVRNHNQLQVPLPPPRLDDGVQALGQAPNVVAVEVRRR